MPEQVERFVIEGRLAVRTLIVNADDFGLTRGVSAGILAAHRHGIVTSTTVLVTADPDARAAGRARATPGSASACTSTSRSAGR